MNKNLRIDSMHEMMFVAPTNVGKQVIHKKFSLLIGWNDVLQYDVTEFSAFSATKHHFRWSDKRVVDMLIRIMPYLLLTQVYYLVEKSRSLIGNLIKITVYFATTA